MDSQTRTRLRMEIRNLLETSTLEVGMQTALAVTYKVGRVTVNQIVRDERERLKNPASWEMKQAKKRGERVNIGKLLIELKDHPVFRQKQDPEN